MAEMLIRVHDRDDRDDPRAGSAPTARGDVIVVVPDGHAWGRMERKLPCYRILALPNVEPADLLDHLGPEPGDASKIPGLLQRAFFLDVDSPTWPADLGDDGRKFSSTTFPGGASALAAFKRRRPGRNRAPELAKV